jgi:hypothetical protein
VVDENPWADSETEAVAAAKTALQAAALPEWCMQIPTAPHHSLHLDLPSAPVGPSKEDDWL